MVKVSKSILIVATCVALRKVTDALATFLKSGRRDSLVIRNYENIGEVHVEL